MRKDGRGVPSASAVVRQIDESVSFPQSSRTIWLAGNDTVLAARQVDRFAALVRVAGDERRRLCRTGDRCTLSPKIGLAEALRQRDVEFDGELVLAVLARVLAVLARVLARVPLGVGQSQLEQVTR